MAATDGRRALQTLSSAALALPAYAGAPPAGTTLDYHFFHYAENDLPADRVAGSQRGRYDIDGHKLQAETPLGARYGLRADLTVETMSGASPWFVSPGQDGRPVQVMSGASIEDSREDLSVEVTRYDDERTLGLSLGHSQEDDYTATYVGFQYGFEPQGGQLNYGIGLSYSNDELEPTDGGSTQYPDRIIRASKDQLSLQASLTQILSANSLLQWGLSYARNTGYLSDPYKLVFADGNTAPDTRPDERNVGAWYLRWRRYFKPLAGAWHVDYRGTADDWEVQTTTVETHWVQRLAQRWRLSSGLRYYSQSQADFYAPYFEAAPANGLMSSDYRLSPYGAVSAMLQVNYSLQSFELGLGYEYYEADGSLALGNVSVENPGLLSFELINLRVAWRFD